MTTDRTALEAARDALIRAQRFIKNGREFGYIRMPDADCPDPAHDTPGAVDAALATVTAALSSPPVLPGWQTIETAPKDGTLILLGARNGVWVGKYVPVYGSGYVPECPWASHLLNHDHMGERRTSPTHWQPLPAGPGTPAAPQASAPALDDARDAATGEGGRHD